jgi:hypothetical protein
MSRLPTLRADQELDELAKRFEHWRATRLSKREPIPQPLWDEAAGLSRRRPISSVAKTLRLSAGELKRQRERLDGLPSVGRAQAVPASTAVFVPVMAPEDISVPGAEIEVHRADGTRLCIRYPERAPVVEVLRAFLAG